MSLAVESGGSNLDDPASDGQFTSTLTEYSLEWGGVPNYTYLRFSGLEECTAADCASAGAVWSSESGVTGTSLDLTGKDFGNSYSYRIRVCNNGSDGIAENTDDRCSPYTQISVTVGDPLDGPPANIGFALGSDEVDGGGGLLHFPRWGIYAYLGFCGPCQELCPA